MNIKPLHANFKLPTKSTSHAGAYDLYMPERGEVFSREHFAQFVNLGFAAAVPEGHVALLLPRSGAGANKGVALNNTVGVIDADYRGEWKAALRVHNGDTVTWGEGDRLLQVLIVPVAQVIFNVVDELPETDRGAGGFGSTGQ